MKYIEPSAVKIFVQVTSIISIIMLLFMKYDSVFMISILLPLTYLFLASLWIDERNLRGIGCIFLFGMYCFRMCVLPVICAYGNFWIEPERESYINYFAPAVILMCIECCVVLALLRHYSRIYNNNPNKFKIYSDANNYNNSALILFAKLLFVVYIMIFMTYPRLLLDHYMLLILSSNSELTREAENAMGYLLGYGKIYWIMVIMDIVTRPAMLYVFIDWLLKKGRKGIILSAFTGLTSILWITDRRILSFLTGIVCFIQILLHVKSRVAKKIIYSFIFLLAVITIIYCFYGLKDPALISRKFQRYFSGPVLVAVGLKVYVNFFQTPLIFLKLLLNDIHIFTGLFGHIATPTTEYTRQVCGYGIWNPAIAGALQYFHAFGFMMFIPVVKFLVYSDYVSMHSKTEAEKMMMNYITVSLSIYTVMYTLELIYYNIIATGGLFLPSAFLEQAGWSNK